MELLSMQNIILTKRGKILLPALLARGISTQELKRLLKEPFSNSTDSRVHPVGSLLLTFLKNLSTYGYMVDNVCIVILRLMSNEDIIALYNTMMYWCIEQKGYAVNPLYPGFPQQVMETTESQRYLDACIYAFSNFSITPEDPKLERPIMIEDVELKVIKLAIMEDLTSIFTNILSSKSSVSKYDYNVLYSFVHSFAKWKSLIPDEIPMKEILCKFLAIVWKEDPEEIINNLCDRLKTVTDFLRFYVAINDGDVSLANPTIFRNFKNQERKKLTLILNDIIRKNYKDENAALSEMYNHRNLWITFVNGIHPDNYKVAEFANSTLNKLKDKSVKPVKFGHRLNIAIENYDVDEICNLMKERPGEVARQLDNIFRNIDYHNALLECFLKVGDRIPTPLLWQIHEHFKMRIHDSDNRIFFPKGNTAKTYTTNDSRDYICTDTCKRLSNIALTGIKKQYSKKESLNGQKVYIDPALMNIKVPTSLRSVSAGARSLPRGSKLKLTKNIIRGFVYWHQSRYTTDLDISAILLDKDFKYMKTCSYLVNLVLEDYEVYHSGDVRTAPNGAFEAIDINMDKLKEKKVAYVVFIVSKYEGETFKEMKESFCGFMEREDAFAGEVFEPSTVQYKSDIVTEAGQVIPFLIDVRDKSYIWIDMVLKNHSWTHNSVNQNKDTIINAIKAFINYEKASLYDVISLNVQVRGGIEVFDYKVETTDNKEENEVPEKILNIGFDGDITPYDHDIILKDWI